MKKKILLVCVVFTTFITSSYAQILNQDASGKSSILTQGTSFNFNITETQIQATHYGGFARKGGLFGDINNTGLWGIDVKAKNNTGVGNLFDSGKFSPEGTFSATIGLRHTRFLYPNNSIVVYNRISDEERPLIEKLGVEYAKKIDNLFDPTNLTSSVKDKVKNDLNNMVKKFMINVPELLSEYTSKVDDPDQLIIINEKIGELQIWVESKSEDFLKLQNLKMQKDQVHVPKLIRSRTTYWYLRGGSGASQFTYDRGAMFSDYKIRFMDTTSVNYYFELGVSHQWKKNFIGINLGYSRQDNMSALTSADYSYSYQDTSVNTGKLTKQKSFTAYSGNYGFYGKIYLNADYQHLITIATSKYLSVGPYVRWSHHLNADDLAKDNTILGVSFNYLDGKAGKLLGGIYLQSSDISGKTQPQFSKTIQFGLIAKFNLSSIFILD